MEPVIPAAFIHELLYELQEHEGFSQNKPVDVYFGGKRMNENR